MLPTNGSTRIWRKKKAGQVLGKLITLHGICVRKSPSAQGSGLVWINHTPLPGADSPGISFCHTHYCSISTSRSRHQSLGEAQGLSQGIQSDLHNQLCAWGLCTLPNANKVMQTSWSLSFPCAHCWSLNEIFHLNWAGTSTVRAGRSCKTRVASEKVLQDKGKLVVKHCSTVLVPAPAINTTPARLSEG